MNFLPKQHLEIGNYIKYLDEILHKCEKGIEYCKICPNEFVCSELEKDDFGLTDATISGILGNVQSVLNKIPGYLNPEKRNDLNKHIRLYINESPVHERNTWENSILDILLGEKLSSPAYKPGTKIGAVRTLLTYGTKINFSTYLKCLNLENKDRVPRNTSTLPDVVTTNSILAVKQYLQSKCPDIAVHDTSAQIKFHFDEIPPAIIQRCNLNDTGLAAAVCYYSMLKKLPIPGDIVITGGMDNQGKVLQVDSLDDKIETVLRELHFINKIIIPKNSSFVISTHGNINIIGADNLEQAINIVFKNHD